MFAHLGFIRESGGGRGVDKGRQIRLQSAAAAGRSNKHDPMCLLTVHKPT